jgi:hypothetical protein
MCVFCTKLGMLLPWDREEILKGSKLRRSVLRAVSVAQKLITTEERRQDQSCLFQKRDYRNKGPNPENMSCVLVPVKVVYVAWKLSTIEKRCQDQSCWFRLGCYRNKRYKSEKLSWVRVPMKIYSIAWKLSSIKEQLQDQSLFRRKITGTTPKICPRFESQWRSFP